MRFDARFSFGGQETESDKPPAPSAPKPSLRAKRSNPYSGAEHAASDSRRTGSCGLSMDCFASLAMTASAALIPTALVYVATEVNITRTLPRAKLLLARRPHQPPPSSRCAAPSRCSGGFAVTAPFRCGKSASMIVAVQPRPVGAGLGGNDHVKDKREHGTPGQSFQFKLTVI